MTRQKDHGNTERPVTPKTPGKTKGVSPQKPGFGVGVAVGSFHGYFLQAGSFPFEHLGKDDFPTCLDRLETTS